MQTNTNEVTMIGAVRSEATAREAAIAFLGARAIPAMANAIARALGHEHDPRMADIWDQALRIARADAHAAKAWIAIEAVAS